jgi:glycine cleavage system aminomethyltransferase T
MGTDQGKSSNVVGLALLAEALDVPIASVGTTTFRPPYTPVALGAFPGIDAGAHVEPTRYSAMHDWHVAHGARFVNAGLWKRPHSYPRAGESADDAAFREARNVRVNVGVVDVSTLGKIELMGKDVAEFLNRVYINRWDTLAVGACRVRTATGLVPARLFRISYSGELAYEVHVPADRGRAMWKALIAAGAPFGIMPYGTEAMSTLRIEKGHIVIGAEADGRTTAADLGLGSLVSATKDFIGRPLLARPALTTRDRWQLVGIATHNNAPLPRAAKIVADPDRAPPNPMLGHVTSWCWSPHVAAWIALALVANGRARHGEILWAVSPLAGAKVRVKVGPPCFVDPNGERLRG